VSLFEVYGSLVEARVRLRGLVDDVLAKLATGRRPSEVERE